MNENQLDLKDCCRTCGANLLADCGKCLFQSTENASEAVSTDILKLLSLLKFNIHKEDGLPHKICKCCLETFIVIEEFRRKCQRMQDLLMQIWEKNQKTDEASFDDLFSNHHQAPGNPQTENDRTQNDCNFEVGSQIEHVAPQSKKPKTVRLKEKRQKRFSDEQLKKCQFCNEKFAMIVAHTRYCLKRNVEICYYCDLEIPTAEELKAHVNEKHSDKLPACSICAVTFPTFKERLLHRMKIHTPFRCKFCDYTAAKLSRLRHHIDAFHAEKLNKSCPICQKVCATQKRYDYHMKTHDPSSKNFACRYCNKRFSRSDHLNNHERTHTGEKPFICEECGRGFSQIGEVIAHRKYIHLKEQREYPYRTGAKSKNKISIKCPHAECGKILQSKSSFEKHLAVFHRATHETDRPHKCDICNKAFRRSAHLESHVRMSHKKGQNFACPHCNKKFPGENSLSEHMVRHSDEKSHKCTDCTNLTGHHNLKHTNEEQPVLEDETVERPYKCPICGKAFRMQNHLSNHRKLMHTDNEKQLWEDEADDENTDVKL